MIYPSYPKEKLRKIKDVATKAMLPFMASTEIDDGNEIIGQLKEKFHACTNKSQKVQILTVLPKSWSVKKFRKNFQ